MSPEEREKLRVGAEVERRRLSLPAKEPDIISELLFRVDRLENRVRELMAKKIKAESRKIEEWQETG